VLAPGELAGAFTRHTRDMIRQADDIAEHFTGNADSESASGGLNAGCQGREACRACRPY